MADQTYTFNRIKVKNSNGEVRRYLPEDDITSRYRKDERIVYDTGEEIVETKDRIVFPFTNKDKFVEVYAGFENRLDLISWRVYGSPLYWWVIASASGIYDPFDVPVGTKLRIPPIEEVMRL